MKQMKWNPLGLLVLLSILSVLGFLTENRGYLGFLGFLAYIRYFRVIPDECFWQNVKNAATIAFMLQLLSLIPAVFACFFFAQVENIVPTAFAWCFTASLIAFSVALVTFEKKENEV